MVRYFFKIKTCQIPANYPVCCKVTSGTCNVRETKLVRKSWKFITFADGCLELLLRSCLGIISIVELIRRAMYKSMTLLSTVLLVGKFNDFVCF